MEKRKLGRTDLEVTFIGFGALEIGRDWGLGLAGNQVRPDEESAIGMLDFVLDSGVNLVDTARAYHKSEQRIGRGISHRRNEFILTSKCGEHSAEPETYYNFSYKAIRASIEKSLQLLRTDVIDVMQIHFGPHPGQVLKAGETVAAMKEAQAEGKIRFLGASPPKEVFNDCIESGDFDVIQVDYSLLNRENEELIAEATQKNIGILIRGGLAMGYLTPKIQFHLDENADNRVRKVKKILELLNGDDKLLPAVALQFLKSNKNISSVLVGSKSKKHFAEAITALDKQLPVTIDEITDGVSFVE
ncbi:MAG: hypothetical protein GWP06_02390 [Actinobacteria bacterium]|nr:hypothetical protein [Actinomycetota bacterium]